VIIFLFTTFDESCVRVRAQTFACSILLGDFFFRSSLNLRHSRGGLGPKAFGQPNRRGYWRGPNSFGSRQTSGKVRAEFVRTAQQTPPPIFSGPSTPQNQGLRKCATRVATNASLPRRNISLVLSSTQYTERNLRLMSQRQSYREVLHLHPSSSVVLQNTFAVRPSPHQVPNDRSSPPPPFPPTSFQNSFSMTRRNYFQLLLSVPPLKLATSPPELPRLVRSCRPWLKNETHH